MAKNRSQAEAFDFAADIIARRNSAAPAPTATAPERKAPKPTPSKPKAAPRRAREDAAAPETARSARARCGSKPSARPLATCNVQLFADQIKPLAMLSLESGENRSEIVRRLLDAELSAKGYR